MSRPFSSTAARSSFSSCSTPAMTRPSSRRFLISLGTLRMAYDSHGDVTVR